MSSSLSVLKSVFGYNSFRPLQNEIIDHILCKQDTLVIMPTGGGKSLCYQIPALLFQGLTVVISPLISLMKDQVSQLNELGVNAVMLNSSLTPNEYWHNLDEVKSGRAKLLYIAPESLLREDISELLCSINVECITVDEAHCISEWGHDFRKEYRQLASFRKKIPDAVCLAFTATATEKVQVDIMKNLKMHSARKFIASFNRTNLFLKVSPRQNSFKQTVDFINEHKGQSGIIYCFSRKQVDDLHDDLSSMGYPTLPYHAGLSDEERHRNQELFIKDEVDIMIATIAFGMGINKPNVRFVLHHDLPKNIESYYQEIGRAGRDGLKADCLLLFSYGDIAKINYFIEQKETDKEYLNAKAHLTAMINYAESTICRRVPLIEYFGENYSGENCGMCDNCSGDAVDLVDITLPSQKFLSAVKRTREMYGAVYIIDLLTGKENDRILSNGHQNLTVFGIGSEFDKSQWQYIVQQLLAKKYLERDMEFGSLKVTPAGNDVLKGNLKVSGRIKEKHKSKEKKKKIFSSDINIQDKSQSLFEILRAKRKELAQQHNVPPYVIFPDKTLQEMCVYLPQDKRSFLEINGVGKQKLENYGDIFISLITGFLKDELNQAARN